MKPLGALKRHDRVQDVLEAVSQPELFEDRRSRSVGMPRIRARIRQ